MVHVIICGQDESSPMGPLRGGGYPSEKPPGGHLCWRRPRRASRSVPT